MNNEQLDNVIIPHRFIPFDIGTRISGEYADKMMDYFVGSDYEVCEIPDLLKSLSIDVLFKIKINISLKLYIFSFGIGVFVLEDDLYELSDKYAVDYCDYRKDAHKKILEFNHPISNRLRQIIDELRCLLKDKRANLRPSANAGWEYNGLSYVMTISYIIKKQFSRNDYENLSDVDKKNLQIMLQPSIAHKEDTLTLGELRPKKEIFDPYNFKVDELDSPRNWIKSEDCSIYISWAAVVVYLHDLLGIYMDLIECLEVDLQAMWLYTYCRYINLKSWSSKKKLSSVELKREKYNFQRKYNEFISDNDSSLPIYISEIRNELISTSGIEHEKNDFMEYLNFCIDETESYEIERQHKYSVMNEILLFIIAFIQIAPMLYSAMTGEYADLQLWPIIIMAVFIAIAIWFILKKE